MNILTLYSLFKQLLRVLLILSFGLFSSCVKEFIPVVENKKELLVVEGLITDQFRTNTIKLSKSLPFGLKSQATPLSGCYITISDDLGNVYSLKEGRAGTYLTDSTVFQGVVGRFYTLHIRTNANDNFREYESFAVEMRPVPPIDSIYYKKTVIEKAYENFKGIDGCQIYLNTHDPQNNCKYYRWDFTETWVLRLLFPVKNMTCWISENSSTINIKSTAAFDESRVTGYPINYITNVTDRLKTRYSILVNQYSLNEDEYIYWEKLQKMIEQAGGLYDIIPSSVEGNLWSKRSIDKVLGYFSVSAVSSKRIFIKDNFEGIIDRYINCVSGRTYDLGDIPGLDLFVWVLDDEPFAVPPYKVLTKDRGCADCTVRGSNKRPDYWQGDSINTVTGQPYK
jgi:hypothetical protein